jgi:hypothetical protein
MAETRTLRRVVAVAIMPLILGAATAFRYDDGCGPSAADRHAPEVSIGTSSCTGQQQGEHDDERDGHGNGMTDSDGEHDRDRDDRDHDDREVPPMVVPEAPVPIALPLSGLAVLGGMTLVRRRRRSAA